VSGATITDGFAEWVKCARSDCDLQVVRPGKVQCSGEYDDMGCPDDVISLIAALETEIGRLKDR
jgi:hypothetical protein